MRYTLRLLSVGIFKKKGDSVKIEMVFVMFFGVIFSGYVAAAQSHNLYTHEEVLKMLRASKNYERKLEEHIRLQDELIDVLKGRLLQAQVSEAQAEAATGGNVGT